MGSVFGLGYGLRVNNGTEGHQWFEVKRTIEDPSRINGDGSAQEEAFDHIDSLPDCKKPQSLRSMSAMAKDYKPSKFGYFKDGSLLFRHAYYQNIYPKFME